MKFVSHLILPVVAALAFLAPNAAVAQVYPVKPIRFVIGPTPDLLPRLVGQKLAESWGQQVVIDQRPGAGGIIAADTVAKAQPDGYTWLVSISSLVILSQLYSKLPYDFERDLAPVAMLAKILYLVVVHPSVPAKSLAELVQLARAKPGQLNYGSSGTGAQTQLLTEMFKHSAKVDIVHVPYKGVVPAVTDLVGGQVQIMFAVAQASGPHVQTGKLRALAITSAKRSSVFPDVPTIAEAGYPELDVLGWNAVHVPAKTPRAIIYKINNDIAKVLDLRDVKDRMFAAGFEPAQMSVEEFDAYTKMEARRYAKVIRESNIRVD